MIKHYEKIFYTLFIIQYSLLITNAQWVQQYSGTTSWLTSVWFVNGNTGYTVGLLPGVILKTTNGGVNWMQQLSTDTIYFTGVDFIDVNTGWACANFEILHTTNGGINWVIQSTNDGGYGISFINANTGYLANGPPIRKTTDGGHTWFLQGLPGGINSVHAVRMLTVNYAFAVGAVYNDRVSNSAISKTTNGGVNWILGAIIPPLGSATLYGVAFGNANTGIAVGDLSNVWRSTDSGTSWRQCRDILYGFFTDVSSPDANHYTAVGGGGTIIRTTNAGVNWVYQTSGTYRHLDGVYFIDSLNGYAVGDSGTILHTTNGGVASVVKLSNNVPLEFKLYQNYPNPFNPATKIRFDIPKTEKVNLIVYDILGRKIATLIDEELKAGTYKVNFDATNHSSGVYFYTLQTESYRETKTMIFIK
jgi:photosystem II stability/assembly factor-like uncharacterized protein